MLDKDVGYEEYEYDETARLGDVTVRLGDYGEILRVKNKFGLKTDEALIYIIREFRKQRLKNEGKNV